MIGFDVGQSPDGSKFTFTCGQCGEVTEVSAQALMRALMRRYGGAQPIEVSHKPDCPAPMLLEAHLDYNSVVNFVAQPKPEVKP